MTYRNSGPVEIAAVLSGAAMLYVLFVGWVAKALARVGAAYPAYWT